MDVQKMVEDLHPQHRRYFGFDPEGQWRIGLMFAMAAGERRADRFALFANLRPDLIESRYAQGVQSKVYRYTQLGLTLRSNLAPATSKG